MNVLNIMIYDCGEYILNCDKRNIMYKQIKLVK